MSLHRFSLPILLFLLLLSSFIITAAPSIYTVDSSELSSAAYTLGIAHPPGYSFYILLAHLWGNIPFSEHYAYRLNLFSAISLSLACLLLYQVLVKLLKKPLVSAVSTLIFAWSYYVWLNGLVAEVYAFQVLWLNVCAFALWELYQKADWKRVLFAGTSYGLAVAASPVTIFFVPAMIYAFLCLPISWKKRFVAGSLSFLVFALFMLYFPLRYADNPPLNSVGHYNAFGEFLPVNLQSLEGLWALLSAGEFRQAFPHSLGNFFEAMWWFAGNYLGLGIVIGGFGLWDCWQKGRRAFWLWLLAFLPYTLFFASYGADDRDMMLLPSFWLWSFPFAYGMRAWGTKPSEKVLLCLLPCLFLGINFQRVNISQNLEPYQLAQENAEGFPENAYVFGYWGDIVALEYLQIVESQRPDVHYYNLFLFGGDTENLRNFVRSSLEAGHEIIFLNGSLVTILDDSQFSMDSYGRSHHQVRLR
jgi:hypothetical protein